MRLKPCPFCGSKNIKYRTKPFTAITYPVEYYIYCANCLCRTHDWGTEAEALSTWNKRNISTIGGVNVKSC
jgi:Lar family restriction alleviation protein